MKTVSKKNILSKTVVAMLVVAMVFSLLPSIQVFAASDKPAEGPEWVPTYYNTSAQTTIDLYNKLLDNTATITSFYGDINNAYPSDIPNQLTEVAAFGAQLTAGITDPYQKAQAIFNWFEQNFTYNQAFIDQKVAFQMSYFMNDPNPTTYSLQVHWNDAGERFDPGPTKNVSDRAYNAYMNKTGVNLDYSMLFRVMAVGAGVPCDTVYGINHTWNIFWTGSKWIIVDASWHEFDANISTFTNESPYHCVIRTYYAPDIDVTPTYYNSSADRFSQVAMYKGQSSAPATTINVPDVGFTVKYQMPAPNKSTLVFSQKPTLLFFNPQGYVESIYSLPIGTQVADVLNGKVVQLWLTSVSCYFPGNVSTKTLPADFFPQTKTVTLSPAMAADPNGLYIREGDMGRGVITVLVTEPTATTISAPKYAAGTHVTGTANNVTITNKDNGVSMDFPAVNIDGNNYIKLRDIAYAFHNVVKMFSVDYDSNTNTIICQSGWYYTKIGGEFTPFAPNEQKTAEATTQTVIWNGKQINLTAFNIDGSNYVKLRDIAILLNFNIIYSYTEGTITLDFWNPYNPADE